MPSIANNLVVTEPRTSITSEDLMKALRQAEHKITPYASNPCREIQLGEWPMTPAQPIPRDWLAEYQTEFRPTGGTIRKETMLSTSSANIAYAANKGQTLSLEVDYDEAVWKIAFPGIPRDKIEVFTVKDVISVKTDFNTLKFQLAENETLKSVTLELGVLTLVIDRPFKRIDVEVK